MKPRLFFFLLLLVLVPMVSASEVPRDFYAEVVKGNIPGHSLVTIQGIDENVATTQYVIWSENAIYVYPPGPTQMNVSSSDVDDTNGGTGTWNVTIYGLDINFTPIIETVIMNGQTPVPTVAQFYRINRMRIGHSGASEENEGMIYIGTGATIAGKPATIYNKIVTETGVSSTAIYTVPDGFTAYLKYLTIGTDTTKILELTLESRCIDCPDNSWSMDYHTHFGSRTISHDVPLPFPYLEHSDIKITARNSVGDAFISSDAFFLLIDNDYVHNSTLLWGDGATSEIVISSEPVNINIESSEVDLLSQIPIIWIVFVSIASIFTAGQKMIPDKAIRNLSFPLGLVSWIVAAYIWAIEYAGTGFFPIVWVHVIPMFLLMAWGLSDLGSNTSTVDKYE